MEPTPYTEKRTKRDCQIRPRIDVFCGMPVENIRMVERVHGRANGLAEKRSIVSSGKEVREGSVRLRRARSMHVT